MRPHPLGISLKHRPYLDVVLVDPEALFDPLEFAVAGEQLRMAHVGHVGDDPFLPIPAGDLLDLVLVYLQPVFPLGPDEPARGRSRRAPVRDWCFG